MYTQSYLEYGNHHNSAGDRVWLAINVSSAVSADLAQCTKSASSISLSSIRSHNQLNTRTYINQVKAPILLHSRLISYQTILKWVKVEGGGEKEAFCNFLLLALETTTCYAHDIIELGRGRPTDFCILHRVVDSIVVVAGRGHFTACKINSAVSHPSRKDQSVRKL